MLQRISSWIKHHKALTVLIVLLSLTGLACEPSGKDGGGKGNDSLGPCVKNCRTLRVTVSAESTVGRNGYAHIWITITEVSTGKNKHHGKRKYHLPKELAVVYSTEGAYNVNIHATADGVYGVRIEARKAPNYHDLCNSGYRQKAYCAIVLGGPRR